MTRADRALPFDEHGNVLRFEGYSKEAFDFLRKLKRNNRREWFQPRKSTYEELLVFPTRALVATVGQKLEKTIPEVRFDPKRAVFRIYRDVRFSNDKSPYKTHVAAQMSFPSKEGATSRPGFYLHVEPGEVFVGGGLYLPSGEQLKRLRLRIHHDPTSLRALLRARPLKVHFGELRGTKLTRAPKGWPPDHPDLDLLRLKQFFVGAELTESAAQRKDFADVVAKHFLAAVPLMRWLDASIR